jgi:uncharacterized membrane protein
MSWPYLHTLVNHFPVVLTVIGALAVLVSAMAQRRAPWIYALVTLTLAGLTIYPAWVTGGRAAGMVHKAWYIAPGAIHSHSTAAYVTLWIVGATGLLALLALITMVRTREAVSPARAFRALVGLGALLSICAVSYTAYLGGQIVVESPILASPTPPVITVPLPAGQPNPASPASPATQPQVGAPSGTAAPVAPQSQAPVQTRPPAQPQPRVP